MHSFLTRLDHILKNMPRWVVIGLSVVMLLWIGAIDSLMTPDLAFSILYLVPISLASWYAGWIAGFSISGGSVLFWLLVNWNDLIPADGLLYTLAWEASSRLAIYLLVSGLFSALQVGLERERRLARTDYLTDAGNTRAFFDIASMELSRIRRYNHPLTIAYMDLDNFKQVNDRFGHSAGDEILRALVKTLKENLRVNDFVARLGGDEFTILFPETDAESAKVMMPRLRQQLMDRLRQGGWPVTISIGVLTCYQAPSSVDALLRMVDGVMYRAKRAGKNRIAYSVCEDGDMITRARP